MHTHCIFNFLNIVLVVISSCSQVKHCFLFFVERPDTNTCRLVDAVGRVGLPEASKELVPHIADDALRCVVVEIGRIRSSEDDWCFVRSVHVSLNGISFEVDQDT